VDSRETIGWYVIDGVLRFMADGEQHLIESGGWFYSPKGVPHTFRNETEAPATALLFAVPSGLDAFFRDVGTKADPTMAPVPPTDADVQRMLEAAPRYGIDIPPPSDA
jgi:glyoxylate utilization-related uncharacterized protein